LRESAIKTAFETPCNAARLGMAVASGDLVMVHGRYTGWGPKPMIAVDIFRVENGKVVEHWDVMQEEVPASHTASGNAMFTLP
jgi:predicted SnoaL-like aldol condensation-catalyzing enzyme